MDCKEVNPAPAIFILVFMVDFHSVYGGFSRNALVFWVEFQFYDSVGFLNDLIDCVGRTCAGLADKRQGRNTQFSMREIRAGGIFAVPDAMSFVSVAPASDLRRDRTRAPNCQTLLGMERIPTDNRIRAMLDDVEPSSLYGLFDEVLAAVERADVLPSLTSLGGHTLIAMDGTQYFASNKLSCRNCSSPDALLNPLFDRYRDAPFAVTA